MMLTRAARLIGRLGGHATSLNPYKSPQPIDDEPITGLSPADALSRHKDLFARRVARQVFLVRLGAGLFAVAMLALVLYCLLSPLFRF